MCMRFRINLSDILQSNTLCTSDLFTCTCCVLMSVCVSFGVAETKDGLPLKFIV